MLNLVHLDNLLNDPKCKSAINLVRGMRRTDGFWQADKSFMRTSWIDFNKFKAPGLWITNYINQFIPEKRGKRERKRKRI